MKNSGFIKEAKFIFENTKKDWFGFFVIMFLKIIVVVFGFVYPIFSQLLIDYGLHYDPSININTNWFFNLFINGNFGAPGTIEIIVTLAIGYVISILLLNTAIYYQGTLSVYFRAKNRIRVRSKAFLKFCKKNQDISSGEAFNLIKGDINGVGELFYVYFPAILMDAFTIVMAITTLNNINAYLLIVPIITAPILLYFCIEYIKKLYNAQLTIREQCAQLRCVTQENIEGMKALKLFNTTEISKQRFKKKNIDYTTSLVEKTQLSNKYSLIFNIIKKSTYILSLIIGGLLAIYKLISIGEFLVFTTFVVSLLNSITTIVSDFANAKLSILNNKKLEAFFDAPNDVIEIDNAESLDVKTPRSLTVNKLKLTIDEKLVLNNVNFYLPSSSSLGIIGGSGDGKTALIKTFLRILPIDSGEILIDKTNVINLKVSNLRNLFSYHMQNPTLFNISIKQNLTYSGCDVTDDRINEVLTKTNTDAVLLQCKNGLNTTLTDGGNSLGTYKTRLSICRTILKDSPIYIFDDFAHAYNDEEKKVLCKNIIELLPNKTTIFLSNNFNDVKNCKYILKLKKGKVEYFGTSKDYSKILKEGAFHE